MKFNHLNVPTHWQNYWTRYPEGHTILEALIQWVSQVDNMVDNVNNWNTYLDGFVLQFDERLQTEVTQTLKDWQSSGFLGLVINDALQWQLDNYITTNEQDKASLITQLHQKASQSSLEIEKARIDTFASLPPGSTEGNAELLDIRVGFDGYTHSTAGNAVRNQTNNVMTEIKNIADKSTNRLNFAEITYGKVPSQVTSGEWVVNFDFASTGYIPFLKGQTYILNDSELWYRYDTSRNLIDYGSTPQLSAVDYDGFYIIVISKDKMATAQMNLGTTLLPYESPTGTHLKKIVGNTSIKRYAVENENVKPNSLDLSRMSFVKKSSNMFDSSRIHENAGVDLTTGILNSNDTLVTSFFIEDIAPGKTYSFSQVNGLFRKTFYTAGEQMILSTTEDTIVAPPNTAKLRLSISKDQVSAAHFNEGNSLLPYEDYYMHIDPVALPTTHHLGVKNRNLTTLDLNGIIDVTETVEGLDGTGTNGYNHDDLTVSDVYALYDDLFALHGNYTKTQIGTDQSGTYPIYSYIHNTPDVLQSPTDYNHDKKPKVIIATGTHGDGPSGDNHESIYSTYFLVKDILENYQTHPIFYELRNGIELHIIPLVNPWGVQNKSRVNSRGVDINRNFGTSTWASLTHGNMEYGGTEPFSETETIALRDYLITHKDTQLFVDYHTTGGVPTDDKWIYFEMAPDCELYYPAVSHIRRMSTEFKKRNYPLSDIENYGYIYNAPAGKMQLWAYQALDINACVLESAPNIFDSQLPEHRKDIMEMSYLNYSNWIVEVLRYLKQ